MALEFATAEEAWKLVDTLVDEFQDRDRVWQDRRTVRFRRMGDQLKSLPLNSSVSDQALLIHQTEIPNQETHKRSKRLIANKPRFEIVVYDDATEVQHLGQQLENGTRALYRWMNRGRRAFDNVSTRFQQGDGLGVAKIDFLPGHGDTLGEFDLGNIGENDKFQSALTGIPEDTEGREAMAFDFVTEQALKKEMPPFRLTAVDPLAFYFFEDGEGISVGAEVGTRTINPILEAFKDYGVELSGDGKEFVVLETKDAALSGDTAPSSSFQRDMSTSVKYVEIRTRQDIIILIEHPKFQDMDKRQREKETERGIMLKFKNPFGPHYTGFELIPGDETGEANHADEYQPPILGVLNVAQSMNFLMTARLSAAAEEAFAPKYLETDPDAPVHPSDEDKTEEVQENREIVSVPGRIRRVESPNADLDKADIRLNDEMAPDRFRDALVGDATSDTSGSRLALQVAQADIQLVPYQNARADAITNIMKAIIYAIKDHGLTVFIPTIPDGTRKGSQIRVSEPASITPEMADMNFELIVTLGADTPVSKFAKWQALAQREEQGTLGYQTLIEQSDVEDPEDEMARVFEGKMLKEIMEQILPVLVKSLVSVVERRFQSLGLAGGGGGGGGVQQELPFEGDGSSGLENGGGGEVNAGDIVRVPGVNQQVVQTTDDFGPRVPVG